MQTANLAQLKQDALDKIIFHMTPKQFLSKSGAWVLDRGEGALLYDVDGREYLDAMSGGLFAVLAGYGREEIARAMYDQALRLNYTSPGAATSVVGASSSTGWPGRPALSDRPQVANPVREVSSYRQALPFVNPSREA